MRKISTSLIAASSLIPLGLMSANATEVVNKKDTKSNYTQAVGKDLKQVSMTLGLTSMASLTYDAINIDNSLLASLGGSIGGTIASIATVGGGTIGAVSSLAGGTASGLIPLALSPIGSVLGGPSLGSAASTATLAVGAAGSLGSALAAGITMISTIGAGAIASISATAGGSLVGLKGGSLVTGPTSSWWI